MKIIQIVFVSVSITVRLPEKKKLQVWFAGTAEVEHTRRLPIQMAGIQFLFTANQIVSMSYCHENQSFITYRLFFQTKSDKIYSRVVTIPHIHSDILLDTQKSCFIRFRAAFLVFSVNFVRKKNTSRNVTVNNNFSC